MTTEEKVEEKKAERSPYEPPADEPVKEAPKEAAVSDGETTKPVAPADLLAAKEASKSPDEVTAPAPTGYMPAPLPERKPGTKRKKKDVDLQKWAPVIAGRLLAALDACVDALGLLQTPADAYRALLGSAAH